MMISVSPALVPQWSSDGDSVHIEGIAPENPTNRIIWDNDYYEDVVDVYTLWARAAVCEANVVGNIVTVELNSGGFFFHEADYAWNLTQASGWQNIPYPIEGARHNLSHLVSNNMLGSPGATLIVQQAHLSTPECPLFVSIGGQITTVGEAYMMDPSIADRIIVFQAAPYIHNGVDDFARTTVQNHLKFVVHRYGGAEWWPNDPKIITEDMVNALKSDLVGDHIRWWRFEYWAGQQYADLGDGSGICWLFGQHTWNNMRVNSVNGGMLEIDSLDWYQQGDVWFDGLKRFDLDQGCDVYPPENLQCHVISANTVELTWTDNCDDETGFMIERKPYLHNDQWHEIDQVDANTTHYVDTNNLHGLVDYTYRVGTLRN